MDSISLENKLNKEYKHIGKIKIDWMIEDKIDIEEISYVSNIMETITPLEIDDPIVVSKHWNWYKLIDWYHRLKSKLEKWESFIDAYVLDRYTLSRNNDTLLEFMKSLVWKTILFKSDEIFVVWNKTYYIEANEWCGWCGNGWSSIDIVTDFLDKKIKIKTVESIKKEDDYEDIYHLSINWIIVAKVDTWWGNWYYGWDFEINLIN